jgi:uncharacterized protein (UPF0218 family)
MSAPAVVLSLPESLRGAFKNPLGPVYTDAETLLSAVDGPVVAVGDVVTYHLLEAETTPAVAVVDERTEREAVDDAVREAVVVDDPVRVDNPAGTLTADLLTALREAVAAGDGRTLHVDGEEDLATLPAVALAPDGAAVVYGQPGEGMVAVTVDPETRAKVRDLLSQMDGDHGRLWDLLD